MRIAVYHLITLATFLVLGCSTFSQPYLIGPPATPLVYKDKILRQCELPVRFVISDDVDERMTLRILEQFYYWNYVTGLELYEFAGMAGVSDANNPDHVFVGLVEDMDGIVKSKKTSTICGITVYNGKGSCLAVKYVILADQCRGSDDNKVFDSIIRHEAGHALGLGHNPVTDYVMYRKLKTDAFQEESLPASDREVEYLRELYIDHAIHL